MLARLEAALRPSHGLMTHVAIDANPPADLRELRNDVTFYSVAFDKIVAEVCKEAKLRKQIVRVEVHQGQDRKSPDPSARAFPAARQSFL